MHMLAKSIQKCGIENMNKQAIGFPMLAFMVGSNRVFNNPYKHRVFSNLGYDN